MMILNHFQLMSGPPTPQPHPDDKFPRGFPPDMGPGKSLLMLKT